MAKEKINNTVLIAPLDWGLGHATRCIPIIQMLVQKKCRVLIAAEGQHRILLQDAFPEAAFLDLKGYRIKYAKKNMLFHLAKQLPGFLNTIKTEHAWLASTIETHNIGLVISDNRYGFWSAKVPSIFITHQLCLQVPFYMAWANKIIRKKLYALINNFSTCWVPDAVSKTVNLSGKLGHPKIMPNIPVKYIGVLSRFQKGGRPIKKYTLMVCLSGPEPQRSLFEAIILPQLKQINGQVLLVRGKPGSSEILPADTNTIIYNHLPAMQLQQAFEQSNFVVSRCGYSTLMDMQQLACKCIYVPTPGQTEQEYLGKRLKDMGEAIVFNQHGFDLQLALKTAETFNFNYNETLSSSNNLLEGEIDKLLGKKQPG